MSLIIIGIDGLDLKIIEENIDFLPNFYKLKEKGALCNVNSIFPADSVPAWNSIFTGLTPGQHGIVRGKDYVESVESFNKTSCITLKGRTFWDELGKYGLKSLIVNPFIAYPPWDINGVMLSGPAFVAGETMITPLETKIQYPEAHGGYQVVKDLKSLKTDMSSALLDTDKVWKEFWDKWISSEFDLGFVTFSTIDRIQHNTWRYYDENDPLYKKDEYLSNCILNSLIKCDNYIGEVLGQLDSTDSLIVLSDHGFGQRPYKLINLNEALRNNGLLRLNDRGNTSKNDQKIQRFKTFVIKILSKLNLLDEISKVLKKYKFFMKYKKSTFMIDTVNSLCYVDELFCGKKPYCGLNFGKKLKKASEGERAIAFNKIKAFLFSGEIPKPLWVKRSNDLYPGIYEENLPDICFELPKEYGIEFELFGTLETKSVTHYKVSGGHLGAGTFGFYSPNIVAPQIESILDFSKLILKLMDVTNENSTNK